MKSKIPLKTKLVLHLKEKRNWVHGGQLERFGQGEGYEGETCKRRLRELTQPSHHSYNPEIEEKYEHGAILYRFKGPQTQKTAPPRGCCAKYVLIGTHIESCPIFEELSRQAKILTDHRQKELKFNGIT